MTVVSALERRKKSLMRFYQKYDPGRIKNIDPLFEHFSFGLILEAIKKKYKRIPEDWEYERFMDLVGHIPDKKIANAMRKQGLDTTKVLSDRKTVRTTGPSQKKAVKPPGSPPRSRRNRGRVIRTESADDIADMFNEAPVGVSRVSAREAENPDFSVRATRNNHGRPPQGRRTPVKAGKAPPGMRMGDAGRGTALPPPPPGPPSVTPSSSGRVPPPGPPPGTPSSSGRLPPPVQPRMTLSPPPPVQPRVTMMAPAAPSAPRGNLAPPPPPSLGNKDSTPGSVVAHPSTAPSTRIPRMSAPGANEELPLPPTSIVGAPSTRASPMPNETMSAIPPPPPMSAIGAPRATAIQSSDKKVSIVPPPPPMSAIGAPRATHIQSSNKKVSIVPPPPPMSAIGAPRATAIKASNEGTEDFTPTAIKNSANTGNKPPPPPMSAMGAPRATALKPVASVSPAAHPIGGGPDLSKYRMMMKTGLPAGAIRNALARDGLDPGLLDQIDNISANKGASASATPASKIDMGGRANKLAGLLGHATPSAAPKKEPIAVKPAKPVDMNARGNKLAALLGHSVPASAAKPKTVSPKKENNIDMNARGNKLAALLGHTASPSPTKPKPVASKKDTNVDMNARGKNLAALLGHTAPPSKPKPKAASGQSVAEKRAALAGRLPFGGGGDKPKLANKNSSPAADKPVRKSDGEERKNSKHAPGSLFAKMHGLLGQQMGGPKAGGPKKKVETGKADPAKAAAIKAKFGKKQGLKVFPISSPEYDKYRKMQKMRLPEGAIRNCLEKDGLDPEGFFNPAEEEKPAASAPMPVKSSNPVKLDTPAMGTGNVSSIADLFNTPTTSNAHRAASNQNVGNENMNIGQASERKNNGFQNNIGFQQNKNLNQMQANNHMMQQNNGMPNQRMQNYNGMQNNGMFNNGMHNNGLQNRGMQPNHGMQSNGMQPNPGMQQNGRMLSNGGQNNGFPQNNGFSQNQGFQQGNGFHPNNQNRAFAQAGFGQQQGQPIQNFQYRQNQGYIQPQGQAYQRNGQFQNQQGYPQQDQEVYPRRNQGNHDTYRRPQARPTYDSQYQGNQQRGLRTTTSQYNMGGYAQGTGFYQEAPAFDYGVVGSNANSNGWTVQWSEDYKRPYYFNEITGESTWVTPSGM